MIGAASAVLYAAGDLTSAATVASVPDELAASADAPGTNAIVSAAAANATPAQRFLPCMVHLPSTPADGRHGQRARVKRDRVESATSAGGSHPIPPPPLFAGPGTPQAPPARGLHRGEVAAGGGPGP